MGTKRKQGPSLQECCGGTSFAALGPLEHTKHPHRGSARRGYKTAHRCTPWDPTCLCPSARQRTLHCQLRSRASKPLSPGMRSSCNIDYASCFAMMINTVCTSTSMENQPCVLRVASLGVEMRSLSYMQIFSGLGFATEEAGRHSKSCRCSSCCSNCSSSCHNTGNTKNK